MSSNEKTEKPTPRRLHKAKEKGDINRSKDLPMAVGFVVAFFCIMHFFPYYKILFHQSFQSMVEASAELNNNQAFNDIYSINIGIIFKIILTLIPIPFSIIVSTIVTGGWVITPNKLAPTFSKMSPITNIKNLFSATHLTDLLKMIAKCLIILFLLYRVVSADFGPFTNLQTQPLMTAITVGFDLYRSALFPFIAILLFFGLLDIPLSKYLFVKRLKMTKQELKEEFKENEGNPQIKSRIRFLQRQFAMGNIQRVVPKADVVLTNPTHYAVALKYDPEKAAAPYVIAKGVDDIALYIKQIATLNQVEVIEYPILARAIYASTRINQQIPSQLYRAIAHILTYVMQLKSWRAGQNDKPILNKQLVIPKEVLDVSDQ